VASFWASEMFGAVGLKKIRSYIRLMACAEILFSIMLFVPFGSGYSASAQSSAMSCDQLWYARNAIFAAKGYCFKTARARAVFGPRCQPPYGKLNAAEQDRVDAFRSWESSKGCASGAAQAAPPPLVVAPPSQASSYAQMNCSQLWHSRNAIFAAKGYCFKTRRARAVFGPRCHPPYGRLSRLEQNQVDAIRGWERSRGCR